MRAAVSNKLVVRNRFGQFIKACEVGGTRTVEDVIKQGADLSRDMAPVGRKYDLRTVPLAESIHSEMTGSTSGRWVATARHALPIEKGAAPHIIEGSPGLSFFWDKMERMFVPVQAYRGAPAGEITYVNHPGNKPQPYLLPAYERMVARIGSIARKNYPG